MGLLKKFCVISLLMFVALTFFGCTMPSAPHLSCSGNVTFMSEGLQDVIIKSNIKDYAITDEFGNFTFLTKAKTLVIAPFKEGYIFEPKQATLTEGENTNINFIAIEVENLEGTLLLNKIVITPTSILTNPDNYVYIDENKEAIKASKIEIAYNDTTQTINDAFKYLYKNEKNEFSTTTNNIQIECGVETKIGVLINSYFISYYQEWETTETEFAYLEIKNPQTNAELQDGRIEYNLYGINNKNNTFTFDITFVFDYQN